MSSRVSCRHRYDDVRMKNGWKSLAVPQVTKKSKTKNYISTNSVIGNGVKGVLATNKGAVWNTCSLERLVAEWP